MHFPLTQAPPVETCAEVLNWNTEKISRPQKKYLCLFTHLTQPFSATLCIAFAPLPCWLCVMPEYVRRRARQRRLWQSERTSSSRRGERKRRETIRMKYAINEPECSPFWVRPHTPFCACTSLFFINRLSVGGFSLVAFTVTLTTNNDDVGDGGAARREEKQNNKKLKV